MDPFSKIPFHVILIIVKFVEDLPSLLYFIQASPAVSALFHDCALEIFDAVIHTSIPQKIQSLLYTIATIRSGKTASHGLYDFMSKIGRYRVHTIGHEPSSVTVREILTLAIKVQHLGHQCLDEMIHRCLKMNVSHMANPKPSSDPTSGYYDPPWARYPRMQQYQPQDSGPPSWMEEQRVYRALWRLQLFFDLQQAALEGKLIWPQEDLQKFPRLTPEEFWDPMEHTLLEELRTVKECVGSLYPDWSMSQLPTYRGNVCYNWTTPIAESPKTTPQYAGQSPSVHLSRPAPGYSLILKGLSSDSWSPVPYVGFPPFRRYGLAIWDRKRLMALELEGAMRGYDDFEDYPGITLSTTNKYFTWRSIMTEADLQHWAEKMGQILDGNLTYSMYTEM